MSYTESPLDPPPIDYGTMGVTDVDKEFGMDCTRAMQLRNTHITGVTVSSINRTDGQPITSSDLTCNNVTVVNGGLQFGWTFTGNGNASPYLVVFALTLSSGSSLLRTVAIEVKPYVG